VGRTGRSKYICWISLISALILLTSCNGRAQTSPVVAAPSATPAENTGGLSPDSVATLRSLEKVDEYPFYVMNYAGRYELSASSPTLPDRASFSCSLFASLSAANDMFYGRNFDWEFSPALLLFTDPPEGYASVSMVDLTFLGITPAISQQLTDLPLVERTALLRAVSWPFDGMNEYGLTIGMAAVPEEYLNDASFDPSRRTIGSIGIIRQVLDHARNVKEAVELFEQYNIDFSGGPPIHYLIADRSGGAVLIEFYDKKMITIYNENLWHMATNHLVCIAVGDGGCPRYKTLETELSAVNGQLDAQSAMNLLSKVKQEITQWSSIYDMTSGDIDIVIGRNYDLSHSFHLDLLEP
jgi:Acyl-coenzyme A:6-aminopenicillanic acid acyl-transferase